MQLKDIHHLLNEQTARFNRPEFIADDPISIPHRFTLLQDIEIAGFLTATISWGNRKAILSAGNKLMHLFNHEPFAFVQQYGKPESRHILKSGFVYRTFNPADLDFMLKALHRLYLQTDSIESYFLKGFQEHPANSSHAIAAFRKAMLGAGKNRTAKHISDPLANSAAKRLNMFLRWMVRHDTKGVDFGCWKNISMAQLSIPLDVHSGATARNLGLLKRMQNDWKAVEELDAMLRVFCPEDPVKYDYALFGTGVYKEQKSGSKAGF